jgi:AraC-like DNA-binding protein
MTYQIVFHSINAYFKARDLLLEQRVRVNEAAIHVGYESAAQFSREFKRYFGNSPSECRSNVSGS